MRVVIEVTWGQALRAAFDWVSPILVGGMFAHASWKDYPLVFDALTLLVVFASVSMVFARDAIRSAHKHKHRSRDSRRGLIDASLWPLVLTMAGMLLTVFYAVWPHGEHLTAGLAGAALVGAVLSLPNFLAQEVEFEASDEPLTDTE